MDHSIKLRNRKTDQECDFADEAQSAEFLANVDDSADWSNPAAPAAPAAEPTAQAPAPARKHKAAK